MLEFLKTPFLVQHFYFYTYLPDDVICNIAICADITFYSKFNQASGLWRQLELASELKSDL